MNYLLFASGTLIILFIFIDFFYTTLSGNGSAFVTKKMNQFVSRAILAINRPLLRKLSGTIHVVMTLNAWLCTLILGAFLVFVSDPEMVVKSKDQSPADTIDRLYYTSYVLSTVGIGDFVPKGDFNRTVTGFLSFAGFILLTTGLAYIISITSALTHKRNLAVFIASLGQSPKELYQYATSEPDSKILIDEIDSLRSLLYNYTHNYMAFPMIENYLSNDVKDSEAVQITSLYEVLRIIYFNSTSEVRDKLNPLVYTLEYFLDIHRENKQKSTNSTYENIARIRAVYWNGIIDDIDVVNIPFGNINDDDLDGLLGSSGWDWQDVYRK